MSIRLYDSAWVALRGVDVPLQVRKDARNAALFHIGDFLYDIDGRGYPKTDSVPEILRLLSLQDARTLGLPMQYSAPTHLTV